MNASKKTLASALTASLLVLGLGACSQSQEEKEEAACESVDQLKVTIDEVTANLDQDSTVDEWRAAREAVDTAVDDAEEKIEDADNAAWDEVDKAWDRFDDAVENIDGSATPAQAQADLSDDLAELRAARDRAAEGLNC